MVELKDHQQWRPEQAAVSLKPDGDGMHLHLGSLKLEGLYVGTYCPLASL